MPFYILAMDYASIAALALITLRWAVERLGFRFAAFAVYGAAVAALSIWLMSFANTPGYRQAWMLTEKIREGLLFLAVLEALLLLVRDFQKVWLRWALVASAGAIFAAAIITALRDSPALGQARVIASGNAAVSIWLGCAVIFFLLIFRDGSSMRAARSRRSPVR